MLPCGHCLVLLFQASHVLDETEETEDGFTLKKTRTFVNFCLSVFPSICLSVFFCLLVCLYIQHYFCSAVYIYIVSFCLFVCLVCLSVYLPLCPTCVSINFFLHFIILFNCSFSLSVHPLSNVTSFLIVFSVKAF